jgi:hypothetical protein
MAQILVGTKLVSQKVPTPRAFSAFTLAVSEPFLLPAAENRSPGW